MNTRTKALKKKSLGVIDRIRYENRHEIRQDKEYKKKFGSFEHRLAQFAKYKDSLHK